MNNKILTLLLIALVFTGGYFLFISPKKAKSKLNQKTDEKVSPIINDETPQEATKIQNDQYVQYSSQALEEAQADGRAVIFFHASWCPTCKVADRNFKERGSEIPEDVTILKTNYDKETELKDKYGITYQHTFVQVDENGDLVTKWAGGDIGTLLENLE